MSNNFWAKDQTPQQKDAPYEFPADLMNSPQLQHHWGEGCWQFMCPICNVPRVVAVPVGAPKDLWHEFYQAEMDAHIEWHFQRLEGRQQ